jgi:hypothetical protein
VRRGGGEGRKGEGAIGNFAGQRGVVNRLGWRNTLAVSLAVPGWHVSRKGGFWGGVLLGRGAVREEGVALAMFWGLEPPS